MESGYICNICNKNYKSYKTLWKHNKDFHVIKKDILSTKNTLSTSFSPPINDRPKKTLRTICNYCNLTYASYNGVLKHEKICKEKNNDIIDISNNTISEQITTILKKDNVNKMTISKINKLLSQLNINNTTNNNTTNNNTTNNNTTTNNNGIINNNTFNIIQLGEEDLTNFLSKKEIISILNKKTNALLELLKVGHFNPKYPQLHSIILTDRNRNIVYVYSKKRKEFIIKNKDEVINDLIDYKVHDIEQFYGLYQDILEDHVKTQIETIIEDRYDNDDKPKQNKKIREDVQNLMYNNRNIVKHLLE
uniref:C2H2-type domain-containing protein n=1 Tax=viral metagenome TaxID=1070528 RepID=A0A6C0HV27_9ZZZZ